MRGLFFLEVRGHPMAWFLSPQGGATSPSPPLTGRVCMLDEPNQKKNNNSNNQFQRSLPLISRVSNHRLNRQIALGPVAGAFDSGVDWVQWIKEEGKLSHHNRTFFCIVYTPDFWAGQTGSKYMVWGNSTILIPMDIRHWLTAMYGNKPTTDYESLDDKSHIDNNNNNNDNNNNNNNNRYNNNNNTYIRTYILMIIIIITITIIIFLIIIIIIMNNNSNNDNGNDKNDSSNNNNKKKKKKQDKNNF